MTDVVDSVDLASATKDPQKQQQQKKVDLYGRYNVDTPVTTRDVYQTVYKDGRKGKLWMWTKDGTHENPTNRRYISSDDDLRHVLPIITAHGRPV